MKLGTVYARFYKSFNIDHIRKATGSGPKGDWEMFEDHWHPYVEVPVDGRITTVVGANESGKSHLLSAIEKAVTGENFSQRDLCRYCDFFGVERDRTCWPHLGVAWTNLTMAESEAVGEAAGLGPFTLDHFMMFREGPTSLTLWLPDGAGGWKHSVLSPEDGEVFTREVLPRPFRIFSDVALPDAVPLAWLRNAAKKETQEPGLRTSRRDRARMLEDVAALQDYWGADHSSVSNHAPTIFSMLTPLIEGLKKGGATTAERRSLGLAKDLLLTLARVEPDRLADLADAIADGEDGYANAITESINNQLERRLNFRKWWVQDRDFSLRVTPREHELVFTIRDRTGTEYTFGERSSGLKYFLSYLIQCQAHRPAASREQILLMDEPDTYLSAEAQQDLMRIFRDLAEPQSDRPPIQVVYVTHSPFLIDKNYADRIRVLEKGKGYDGTRIIRNVSRNHYEPLRSAFGAFVGETAFIGSVNLLVEGVSDQILLAGAARLIRSQPGHSDRETLDLNRLVIVPCGSASQVPYMVYLVRGRDAEKPPVIALLDSDGSGNEAARLMRKDKRFKSLIDAEQVLQLADLGVETDRPLREIEDLIPMPLVAAAVNDCIAEVTRFRTGAGPVITEAALAAALDVDTSTFGAIEKVAKANNGHIEKLAFARAVIERCTLAEPPELAASVDLYASRMRTLFQALNKARREAERAASVERLSSLVDRQRRVFMRDHPDTATREQGLILIEDIDGLLDGSIEADAIRVKLQSAKRDFKLDDEPATPIADYQGFQRHVAGLKDALDAERLLTAEALAAPVASAATALAVVDGVAERQDA